MRALAGYLKWLSEHRVGAASGLAVGAILASLGLLWGLSWNAPMYSSVPETLFSIGPLAPGESVVVFGGGSPATAPLGATFFAADNAGDSGNPFFLHLNPGWDQVLFPPENVDGRRRLFRWDRILVVGQVLLVGGSLYMGWWQLPLLVTFGSFYGGFVFLLCNNAQHIGMTDNVPDFRLCTRTIILNPVVRFLYWHMNYHIEHHMYAAVPCYRLGRLHQAIRHDLPPCPVGLLATWRGIAAIQLRQKAEPEYQFRPVLPGSEAAE